MLIYESFFLLFLGKWKHRNFIAVGSDNTKYLIGAGIMDLILREKLERIQKFFSDDLDPDIELLCLLSLLKNSRLTKASISKEYRKIAKYRIEELVRVGNYDPSHLEMIVKTRKALRDSMREGIMA